jgi:hypothetical protein
MVEHCRAPRKRADAIIQVSNAITGEVVGRIGNLSIDGMMLIANRPMRDDALFQFLFHLPDGNGRTQALEIGMHEQWSEPASVPGQQWAGFRIIDIGPEDQSVLTTWIERGRGTLE